MRVRRVPVCSGLCHNFGGHTRRILANGEPSLGGDVMNYWFWETFWFCNGAFSRGKLRGFA